jgi:hypothetical protein
MLINGDNTEDAILNASMELHDMKTANPEEDFLSFTIIGVKPYEVIDKTPINFDYRQQNGGDEFIVEFDMLHS